MTPARPEIGKPETFQFAQALDLGPKLGLGAGVENVERKPTLSLHRLAGAKFAENGKCRDFPHRGVGPRPVEMQFVLSVDLPKLVFGKLEVGQPADEVRRKHLGFAIEGVAGEPNKLLLAEPDCAGVVQLSAKLLLVDHL